MINVDTDVLVRAFLADDKIQTTKAQKLIATAFQEGEHLSRLLHFLNLYGF